MFSFDDVPMHWSLWYWRWCRRMTCLVLDLKVVGLSFAALVAIKQIPTIIGSTLKPVIGFTGVIVWFCVSRDRINLAFVVSFLRVIVELKLLNDLISYLASALVLSYAMDDFTFCYNICISQDNSDYIIPQDLSDLDSIVKIYVQSIAVVHCPI